MIESVKHELHGERTIIRLYECYGQRTEVTLKLGKAPKALKLATMMEDELETAQETVERQKLDASRQTQALMAEQQRADATGLLWQLEYRWASGDYDACRALVAQLKPLAHALRTESGEGVPSELARFQALAAAPELDAGQDAPQTP